jgi:putative flippase GtrA
MRTGIDIIFTFQFFSNHTQTFRQKKNSHLVTVHFHCIVFAGMYFSLGPVYEFL